MCFIIPIMWEQLANNSTALSNSNRNIQLSTHRLENKRLRGYQATNESCVLCQRTIICSTCTEWWEDEILTLLGATILDASQYYQRKNNKLVILFHDNGHCSMYQMHIHAFTPILIHTIKMILPAILSLFYLFTALSSMYQMPHPCNHTYQFTQ